MSRSLKTVKSNPLAGKVKKLMQTDEDVGKIAQGAPLLLGDANGRHLWEIFKPSMVCRKAYVASNSKMDFLADKVAAVPDFVEEEAGPAKKQRSDLDLASSSSGLQLAGTISPPSSSKGSRGRGRARTRGRGSVRLAAPENRVGHVKDEDNKAQATQSMVDATPAKAVETRTAPETIPEAEDIDSAMPQAQASGSEQVLGAKVPTDPEAPDLVNIQPGHSAMCAPGHEHVDAVDAGSMGQQPAQDVIVTEQQAAHLPILTAAATLKRHDTFVEEDDYDADD